MTTANLTEDPQSEISLIWYGRRAGLEDRVFRIRTERSSATIPDTRTNAHASANVEVIEQANGNTIKLRFNWHNDEHPLQPYRSLRAAPASTRWTCPAERTRSSRTRQVVLKTDYIRHVIDVYHI